MSGIAYALAPIFLLILAGYAIKTTDLVADTFWSAIEWITYYLFFPALLVHSIATAEIDASRALPMAAALIGGVAVAGGVAHMLRPVLKLSGPAFTSLYQGSFRPNTYVAIATADALFDKQGMLLITFGIVAVVPTVNILSVMAMVRHASPLGVSASWRQAMLKIIANPIILGCLAGFVVNISGFILPSMIDSLLETMGRAALPLSLLTVGVKLNLKTLHKAGTTVAATTAIKLAVLPMTVFILSKIIGMDKTSAAVCILYASVPASASSYVLARRMGGDGELMANIVTATTLAAIITMPLWAMVAINT